MPVTFPNESAAYRTARNRLLNQEIELRRTMERVAQARRGLPPGGLVPQDYEFDGLVDGRPGKVKLSELFAPGKPSLVIYHMMFPRYPTDPRPGVTHGETAKLAVTDQPCPSCTVFIDQIDAAAPHVAQRVNFAVVAKTALPNLLALARDRGWRHLRLLSSAANTFNRDYNVEDAEGHQAPLTSVFHKDADGVRHFWSSEIGFAPADPGQDQRINGTLESLWNIFDLTPEGRDIDYREELQYGDCCATTAPAA